MIDVPERSSNGLPLGELVEETGPVNVIGKRNYAGQFAAVHPVQPESDVDELFQSSHGSNIKEHIWTYMPYGPFPGRNNMLDWLRTCQASTGMTFFTVVSKELDRRVGMLSILNAVLQMRTVELGNIWYAPRVHHTKINTEVVYLMLTELFDRLNYRRAEWKCDALNARSRAAALRLGFSFEGIFRQHYIIKNRNRDTAWFAMIDRDWPAIRSNMENWLYSGDGHISLSALNKNLLNPTCEEKPRHRTD